MARSRFCFSMLSVCACFAVVFTARMGLGEINVGGYVNPDDPATWTSSTDLHIGSQFKSGEVNVFGKTANVKNCYLGVGSDSDVSDTYGKLSLNAATLFVSEDFYMGHSYVESWRPKGIGELAIISGSLCISGDFNNDSSTIYINPLYRADGQPAIQIDGNFNSYDGTIKIDCSRCSGYVSFDGGLIDSYTPISCTGTWNNTSPITVIGGRWDDSTHTVRLSDRLDMVLGGEETTFNPVNTQQIALPDGALTMAFEYPVVDRGDMSVAVAQTSHENVLVLQNSLMPTQNVASSYDFDVINLPDGSAVTLTFQLDDTVAVTSVDQISIYHGVGDLSGGDNITWEHLDFDDSNPLIFEPGTIGGGTVFFGVTQFSSYAVVVNVPEPATITLLGLGAAAALFKRRKTY